MYNYIDVFQELHNIFFKFFFIVSKKWNHTFLRYENTGLPESARHQLQVNICLVKHISGEKRKIGTVNTNVLTVGANWIHISEFRFGFKFRNQLPITHAYSC